MNLSNLSINLTLYQSTGNKTDLSERRQVSVEEGEDRCVKEGILFIGIYLSMYLSVYLYIYHSIDLSI
jgi:hypothetical protein